MKKRPTLDQLREAVKDLSVVSPPETPFSEKYACPTCDELHDDSRDAADCCEWKMEPLYVCNLCEDSDTFDTEDEVKEHIEEEHSIQAEDRTPQELYLDLLREGKAPGGQ